MTKEDYTVLHNGQAYNILISIKWVVGRCIHALYLIASKEIYQYIYWQYTRIYYYTGKITIFFVIIYLLVRALLNVLIVYKTTTQIIFMYVY